MRHPHHDLYGIEGYVIRPMHPDYQFLKGVCTRKPELKLPKRPNPPGRPC